MILLRKSYDTVSRCDHATVLEFTNSPSLYINRVTAQYVREWDYFHVKAVRVNKQVTCNHIVDSDITTQVPFNLHYNLWMYSSNVTCLPATQFGMICSVGKNEATPRF
jgi:hypothetical protein